MSRLPSASSRAYRFAAVAFGGVIATTTPALAADFYAGKQIKIVVSSDTGGGYDTYSRVLGHHIDRYIPGKPTIIIQNMPGGGGLRAAQFTYKAAPKDGTVLGNIRASNMLDSILGIRGKEIDPTKYEWIGSMAADTDVCSFWHTAGVKTFDDLMKKEVLVGASGKGAQAYSFPNAMNRVLGTKFKIILGYKGAADRILAIERGELQGNCGINGSTIASSYGQLLQQGKIIAVIQSGVEPYPALKNVPLTQSFAKTQEQKDILEAIFSQMAIARTYALAPGTIKERVEILRKAFDASMKDEKLLAEAKKSKIDISPYGGNETARLMAKLVAMPAETKAKAKAAIGN
jgi:tripartite-type tricarboxylate transporter receptor subunit TctC